MNSMKNTGLYLDEKGKVNNINYNEFCRYLLTKIDLIYSSIDKHFYQYEKGGVYTCISNEEVSAIAREIMHSIVPDCWKPIYKQKCLEILQLERLLKGEFNQNSRFINLKNDLFDLKEYKIVAHTSEFLSTIQLPILYDKNAECPKFIKFLHEIFEDDKERIKLIQQLFGYCLTSSTKAQKAFILQGSGANGKSVLLSVLTALVGKENVSNLPISSLGSHFKVVDLLDKNVNIVSEGNFKATLFSSEVFKAVVAGDNCFAEHKYGDTFSLQPKCKIIIAVNHLPNIKDTSYGMERRLIVIPFHRIFRADEQDKFLTKKLKQELSGIFNFALKGLKELRQNKYNFIFSKACDKASREFFHHNNPIKEFVETQIYESPASHITNKELSKIYMLWLYKEGIPRPNELNRREFSNDIRTVLDTIGIPYKTGKKSNGDRRIDGIAVKNELYQQYKQEDLDL